ncbi:hypothetical protein XENOCAPTIV_006551, partial [Xenoophorus captivus]
VFVSDVVKGGLVDTDGRLMQGDQILSVNGEDVRSATQEAVAAQLKVIQLTLLNQVTENNKFPEHQDIRTVEFTKGPGDSLGISIAGGVGSPLGDIPIFIAMMNPNGLAAQTQLKGAAAEDGRLKRGDQIIAVNGQSLEGVTHEEAVGILKRTKGTVTLTVLS